MCIAYSPDNDVDTNPPVKAATNTMTHKEKVIANYKQKIQELQELLDHYKRELNRLTQ